MIYLSCGHTCESRGGLGWPLKTRDYSREGNRSVCYQDVCLSCYIDCLTHTPEEIIVHDYEEMEWLKDE